MPADSENGKSYGGIECLDWSVKATVADRRYPNFLCLKSVQSVVSNSGFAFAALFARTDAARSPEDLGFELDGRAACAREHLLHDFRYSSFVISGEDDLQLFFAVNCVDLESENIESFVLGQLEI